MINLYITIKYTRACNACTHTCVLHFVYILKLQRFPQRLMCDQNSEKLPMIHVPPPQLVLSVYSIYSHSLLMQMIESLEQEYNTLSSLRHGRIVSYLGYCYKPHPNHGRECLFIMTEFMPGVSTSITTTRDIMMNCQVLIEHIIAALASGYQLPVS